MRALRATSWTLVLLPLIAAACGDDTSSAEPPSSGAGASGAAGASAGASTGGTTGRGGTSAGSTSTGGTSAGGTGTGTAGKAGTSAGGTSSGGTSSGGGTNTGGASAGGASSGGAAGKGTAGQGGALAGGTGGTGTAGTGGAAGAGGCVTKPSSGTLTIVPTYEAMGLTLVGATGAGKDNVANVRFRAAGTTTWRNGLPLVWDAKRNEYRGSIVYLTPGTTYEVETVLAKDCGLVATTSATWSETFPVGKTIEVAATSDKPLEITESGTPAAYLLVEPAGEAATIDVKHAADYAVKITGSYVIVRGLTLKGASKHGIVLGDSGGSAKAVTDVVIERNDVSDWGTNYPGSKFGYNLQSAVYSLNTGLERITVQRNRMHDPATTSNSWKELNDEEKSMHPGGPQGITFRQSKGNHVIRYNEIVGNPTHHFNDGMGEVQNFTEKGFPNRDSDIYGNHVAYAWDDGLEIEGADRNVRLWGNYIDHTYIKIAIAPVAVGPIYIWRNVGEVSQTSSISAAELKKGQGFFKSRNYGGGENVGQGAKFIFNNTSLTPTTNESGSFGFLRETVEAGDTKLDNLLAFTVRNNIIHVPEEDRTCLLDVNGDPALPSDFDYDMYDGKATFGPTSLGKEAHGLPKTTATYVAGYGFDQQTKKGIFSLAPGSKGVDAGIAIPNFIETFKGQAPDIGAHESGEPPMEFGVDAYMK